MLSFKHTTFRYEPYPLGRTTQIFDDDLYQKLTNNFPSQQLFVPMNYAKSNKLTLSELYNPHQYHSFIKSHQLWETFYNYIKGPFINQTLTMLKEFNIDIWVPSWSKLRPRFEFSMMNANTGGISPHTDSPNKIITLVISMIKSGEWDKSYGGGLDILKPIDHKLNYNFINKYLTYKDVEKIDTFEFIPNQCVIFIKTFNSWHSVGPMTGPDSVMRKTLTINIEYGPNN